MKKINAFKNNEIKTSKIIGSFGIVRTKGGSMGNLNYSSDAFTDDNRDGKWGPGESMVLYNDFGPQNG